MTSAETKSKSGTSLARMLPGLLVTLVALAVLFYLVDLDALQTGFALADYRWLPLVVLAFFGTLLARTQAWRTILEGRANFRESFLVLNQAYLLNNVLPFRLGELGRALLLSGRVGLSFWRVLSTVVVERVFDLGIAAGLLLATLPLVVGADWARPAALVAIVLVITGFVVLFIMANNPAGARRIVERLTKPLPKLQDWLSDKLVSFLEGLSALKDLRRFLAVAFWMLLAWFFNVAWYYVLLRSFMPVAPWLWAFFSIAVASLGVALPSSPGYVGVLEAAMVGSLSLFDVNPAISLAYALVAHVLYFIITGIIGVYGFWEQGQSLGEVYRKLLNRPAST
ncbi:MAG: lysylphosphatidylglycerol synthase transmembrane domain-containing protein [Anaerolineales bacterium]